MLSTGALMSCTVSKICLYGGFHILILKCIGNEVSIHESVVQSLPNHSNTMIKQPCHSETKGKFNLDFGLNSKFQRNSS